MYGTKYEAAYLGRFHQEHPFLCFLQPNIGDQDDQPLCIRGALHNSLGGLLAAYPQYPQYWALSIISSTCTDYWHSS